MFQEVYTCLCRTCEKRIGTVLEPCQCQFTGSYGCSYEQRLAFIVDLECPDCTFQQPRPKLPPIREVQKQYIRDNLYRMPYVRLHEVRPCDPVKKCIMRNFPAPDGAPRDEGANATLAAYAAEPAAVFNDIKVEQLVSGTKIKVERSVSDTDIKVDQSIPVAGTSPSRPPTGEEIELESQPQPKPESRAPLKLKLVATRAPPKRKHNNLDGGSFHTAEPSPRVVNGRCLRKRKVVSKRG